MKAFVGMPNAEVTTEPVQGREFAIDCQRTRLASRQFLVLLIKHYNSVARNSVASRALTYRVAPTMMVAKCHAQLGLSIVVVDAHA